MTKQELRENLKHRRRALTPAEVNRRSAEICGRVSKLSAYQSAKTVLLYCAAFGEVDPAVLLAALWKAGKTVCLPRCEENPRTLTALTYLPDDRLVADAYGIRIPASGAVVLPDMIDLVLVPGIAFDRQGGRIGFGAGYYDRFLAQTRAKKIGLAYDFQLVEAVYASPHDVAMDYVALESELIVCG